MRSPIQQYIIDRVREKRQAIGMSQEKLSIALGFESQGYSARLKAQAMMTITTSTTLTKLQNYLNVLPGNFGRRYRCKLFHFL